MDAHMTKPTKPAGFALRDHQTTPNLNSTMGGRYEGKELQYRGARMNQTRIGSLIEVAINIAIGFGINWIANLCILPMYGFQITGGQAFTMGLIFTVISVARGYIIRRWFNARLQRAAQRMAEAMA